MIRCQRRQAPGLTGLRAGGGNDRGGRPRRTSLHKLVFCPVLIALVFNGCGDVSKPDLGPGPIEFPMPFDKTWTYDVSRYSTNDSGHEREWREQWVRAFTDTVLFKGETYHVLTTNVGDRSSAILLRQEGQWLFYVSPSDTTLNPGRYFGEERLESLPWKLCDFEALSDTTWSLFYADTMLSPGLGPVQYSFRVKNHGRTGVVVPFGVFGYVHHVEFVWHWERTWFVERQGTTHYYIVDDLGIVKETGDRSYRDSRLLAERIWGRSSWVAELTSYGHRASLD